MTKTRRLPVRPDLQQLQREADALWHALQAPDRGTTSVSLEEAREALAVQYQAASWARLEQACLLSDAIWRDDGDAVRLLIAHSPALLHQPVLVRAESNWGPPMTYAANLGRDAIIALLVECGATDLLPALDRALLQGQVATARMLHSMAGRPLPPPSALDGPAYTLNEAGTALALEFGARVRDNDGKSVAPVDVVLQTDSRKPLAKHAILELYAQHGYVFPDTPMMAFHRGRLEELERHLADDPSVLTRQFRFEEIFPPHLGCHEERFPRTSLDGVTLLHLAVEFDEIDLARWLLARGAPVDARARIAADGTGGQTALFHAVVCYANFWRNFGGATDASPFGVLLLNHGADTSVRVSLRESVMEGNPYALHETREHRDVSPVEWGRAFHDPMVVSQRVMQQIAARG